MSDDTNKPLSIPTSTAKPEKPIVEKPYSEDAPTPDELNEAQKKAEALVKGKAVPPPEIPDKKIKIKKKGGNLKKIGVLAMILFMIIGTFTAVRLAQQRQEYRSEAYPPSEPPGGYVKEGGTRPPDDAQCEVYTGADNNGDNRVEFTPDGAKFSKMPCGEAIALIESGSVCGQVDYGDYYNIYIDPSICPPGDDEEEPPGPEPSDEPSQTPTATPTSPPGLACTDLNYTPVQPEIGDEVDFTCNGSGGIIDHYEFEYAIDGGNWVEIPKPGFGNGQTVSMTVNQMGNYVVRCRACTSIDSSACTYYQTL